MLISGETHFSMCGDLGGSRGEAPRRRSLPMLARSTLATCARSTTRLATCGSRRASTAASKPSAPSTAPSKAAASSSSEKAAAPASSGDAAPASPPKRVDSGFTEGGGDIAFKPTTDGWGYSKAYSSNWDGIFGKKDTAAPAAAAPATVPCEKLAALEAARAVGALSEELFERARSELAAVER